MYNADNTRLISGAADVDNAKKGDITFIAFNNTLSKLAESSASACIVSKYNEKMIPNNMVCLEVNNASCSLCNYCSKILP